MKLEALLLLICIVSVLSDSTKIQEGLFSGTQDTRSVIVTFGSTDNIRDIALHIESTYAYYSKEYRISALYDALHKYSSDCQEPAQEYLRRGGYSFNKFWSSNIIHIADADHACVTKLSKMTDVLSITEDREIPMEPTEPSQDPAPGEGKPEGNFDANNTAPSPFRIGISWALTVMRVEEAWEYDAHYSHREYITKGALKTGQGIVVGGIDTGVNVQHEALRDNFRQHAGWKDGYGLSSTPEDLQGHGTHTMGTICGSKGIGVAPGATFIACRGCYLTSCSDSALLQCCEWMLCPRDVNSTGTENYRNCVTAPDVVSNSWGGGQLDTTFERSALAFRAAGIVPVWSIGNEGPNCTTASSPGDIKWVIGVGATNSDDELAWFSSRGPTLDGRLKPDISAPGMSVKSAWFTPAENGYKVLSGTSMAAPQVTGTVALMLQKCRLPFTTVLSILQSTADRKDLGSTDQVCGGIKSDKFPNHFFGYGRVNALEAIIQTVQLCQANKAHYPNSHTYSQAHNPSHYSTKQNSPKGPAY